MRLRRIGIADDAALLDGQTPDSFGAGGGGVLPTTPATSISGELSMSGGVSITNG